MRILWLNIFREKEVKYLAILIMVIINGNVLLVIYSKPGFTCSWSIMETLEQCVKSVQS